MIKTIYERVPIINYNTLVSLACNNIKFVWFYVPKTLFWAPKWAQNTISLQQQVRNNSKVIKAIREWVSMINYDTLVWLPYNNIKSERIHVLKTPILDPKLGPECHDHRNLFIYVFPLAVFLTSITEKTYFQPFWVQNRGFRAPDAYRSGIIACQWYQRFLIDHRNPFILRFITLAALMIRYCWEMVFWAVLGAQHRGFMTLDAYWFDIIAYQW